MRIVVDWRNFLFGVSTTKPTILLCFGPISVFIEWKPTIKEVKR